MPHEHELRCGQHDVDDGTCCQHCPAWPNRALRDAVLAALDAADAAGVVLSYVAATQRSGRTTTSLQATDDANERSMPLAAGLSILKAAGVDDPERHEPWRAGEVWRQIVGEPSGLTVIVDVPRSEVPALVVEAVLAS